MSPVWAINCTLGNFSKPVATIILPKSPTFLGNFCKDVKIFHVSTEIIFGQLFIDIWRHFNGHTARETSFSFCEDIFKSLLLYLTCLKRVTTYLIEFKQLLKPGFVVVVKWSVCFPYTPPIRVRIRFKSTILIMYKLLEKNENKLKEAGKCPF